MGTLQLRSMIRILALAGALLLLLPAPAAPFPKADAWRSRSIMQVVTDRFGTDAGQDQASKCQDFNRYCGGSWQGIKQMLPYVSDLGFDAIWISSAMEQTKGQTWQSEFGYTGYWPSDFEQVNTNFGAESDLVDLVSTAHDMGIWVMLDIIPNHMGYGRLSRLSPFNDSSFYHDCNGCESGTCGPDQITSDNVEHCRFSKLPDLDQSIPFVSDFLLNWVNTLVSKFDVDGLRVFVADRVDEPWLQALTSNTSVFTLGQFDNRGLAAVAERVMGDSPQMQSSLNFPFYYAMLSVFQTGQRHWTPSVGYLPPSAIHQLVSDTQLHLGGTAGQLPEAAFLLGNFLESDEVPRFLCWNPDIAMYKNALAVTTFYPGIPILYTGGEQGLVGQTDASWNWGYSQDSELYVYIKRLMKYRRNCTVADKQYFAVNFFKAVGVQISAPWSAAAVQKLPPPAELDVYNADNYQAATFPRLAGFTRGDVVVLFNNMQSADLQFNAGDAAAAASAAATLGPNCTNTVTTPVIMLPPQFGLPPPVIGNRAKFQNLTLTNIMDPTDRLLVVNGVTQYIVNRDRSPKVYVVTARSFGDAVNVARVTPLPSSEPYSFFSAKGLSTLVVTIVFYSLSLVLAVLLALSMTPRGPLFLRRMLEHIPAPPLDRQSKVKAEKVQEAVETVIVTLEAPEPRHRLLSENGNGSTSKMIAALGGPSKLLVPEAGGGEHQSLRQGSTKTNGSDAAQVSGGSRMAMGSLARWVANRAAQHEDASYESGLQSVLTPQGVPLRPANVFATGGYRQDMLLPSYQLPASLDPVDDVFAAPPNMYSHNSCAQIMQECSFRALRRQAPRRHSALYPPPPGLPVRGPVSLDPDQLASPSADVTVSVTEVELTPLPSPQPTSRNSAQPAKSMLDILRTIIRQRHIQRQSPEQSNPPLPPLDEVPETAVMHVAMEYTIPHLDMNTQFAFGGLGKVVGIFLSCSPPEDQVLLCAPLYADAYADANATQPSFYPGNGPDLSFVVVVNSVMVPVEVFFLSGADNVTYILLQSDVYRRRKQGTIYKFDSEFEMLTWLAITNQAVAVVISLLQIPRVQFHDYHGSLSLVYLPPAIRPMVMYLAHNAHYNGRFPMATEARRNYLFRVLDLPLEVEGIVSSKGYFDIIHAVVSYLIRYQDGHGVVAVSPRYAVQIHKKFDIFRQLSGSKVRGIMNALPMSESLAELVEQAGLKDRQRVLQEVRDIKEIAKAKFQEKYSQHLIKDPAMQLVCFLGRMTHQKGCDIIALASDYMLQHCPNSQLVMVGPIGDDVGRQAQAVLNGLKEKYPGRIYAPGGVYFQKEDKTLLLQAADFCLMPSRFEPCGLVDIEFGWNGSLIIGHDTGGLGKMPGIFFKVQSSSQKHLTAKLEKAMAKALTLAPDVKRRMVEEALCTGFPTDVMIEEYHRVWDTISQHAHGQKMDVDKQHDDFYEDLWKERNIKDQAAEDKSKSKYLALPYLMGVSISRQTLSDLLMLLLQIYTQIPGALAMGFTLYLEIGETGVCGCIPVWDSSLSPDGASTYLPKSWNQFLSRVTAYFVTVTAMSPIWGIVVMLVRPARYWSSNLKCVLPGTVMRQLCQVGRAVGAWAAPVSPRLAPGAVLPDCSWVAAGW